MTPAPDQHINCRCWKCWLQDNFTAVALYFLVLIGLGIMVWIMHEEKIDDKYVTWFEGFVAGVFSAWTLSLKTNDGAKPQPAAIIPNEPKVKP